MEGGKLNRDDLNNVNKAILGDTDAVNSLLWKAGGKTPYAPTGETPQFKESIVKKFADHHKENGENKKALDNFLEELRYEQVLHERKKESVQTGIEGIDAIGDPLTRGVHNMYSFLADGLNIIPLY